MAVSSKRRNLPAVGVVLVVASAEDAIAAMEAYRVAQNIPKWKIGKLTGYSDATYLNWSGGRANTHLTTFLDTAKALGLRVLLEPEEKA